MAVSSHTRRLLRAGLGGQGYATEVADMVDGGGGSLSAATKDRIRAGVSNGAAADQLISAVENDTALGDYAQARLAIMLGSQGAAQDISSELG